MNEFFLFEDMIWNCICMKVELLLYESVEKDFNFLNVFCGIIC